MTGFSCGASLGPVGRCSAFANDAATTFNPTSVLSVPLCFMAWLLASDGAFLRNFQQIITRARSRCRHPSPLAPEPFALAGSSGICYLSPSVMRGARGGQALLTGG